MNAPSGHRPTGRHIDDSATPTHQASRAAAAETAASTTPDRRAANASRLGTIDIVPL